MEKIRILGTKIFAIKKREAAAIEIILLENESRFREGERADWVTPMSHTNPRPRKINVTLECIFVTAVNTRLTSFSNTEEIGFGCYYALS